MDPDSNAPREDEITVTLTPVSPYDFIDETERRNLNEARKSDPSVKEYPQLPEISKAVPVKFDGSSHRLTVKLTDLEGYSGAFKQLSITLPQRAGTAYIKRVEFIGK